MKVESPLARSLLFAGVGAVFIAIGLLTGRTLAAFYTEGMRQDAVITDIRASRSTNTAQKRAYHLYFTLDTDPSPTERASYIGSSSYDDYGIGDRVEVLVLPAHQRVHVADDVSVFIFPLGLTFMGGVFAIVGLSTLRRRRERAERFV